ncbi:MAG: DUF5107 domain-containing protein [Candidatus Hydrogenedentes bacterium]|nr:DUF5107 domain-containing protein [Candidatus Hydrogenedentota bacterium]
MQLSNFIPRCLVSVVLLIALCPTIPAAPDAAPVKTWEGTLTLPTYPWYDDVHPVFQQLQGPLYYPYTRQDHIAKSSADRTYRALYLENEYLKVTCIPELGGRIYSVLDKTTNEEVFHCNREVKPALIAMRGAWISGGIEWNAGPQGHTVTVVSPVDAAIIEQADGSATLVISNTEKMFKTRWTVWLTLHPGKAYLDEQIRICNPTDGTHPYYFWNCTAFPNLPGTRFMYPMTLGCDHNGTAFFSWPVDDDKDLSWLKNYETMSSIFAYDCVFDFFGAYDVDIDRGIVSYANHHELKGKKAWTWGKDDFGVVSQMALCDAGPVHAQYIEVQSGPLLTQADYGLLEPRQAVEWREFWYPVHGLGDGFEFATRDAAVQTRREGGALEVRVIGTGNLPGSSLTLEQDGTTLKTLPCDLSPAAPVTLLLENAPEGAIRVLLKDADEKDLLDYETPLAIPEVERPDLTEKPARPDGAPTADERYRSARTLDSQVDRDGARAGYEAALSIDPLHTPSLVSLATLDLESGLFEACAEHANKAVERDPECGMAWFLLGSAQLGLKNPQDAATSGYKTARCLDTIALGYGIVGRAKMRLIDYEGALEAFERAVRANPADSRNWAALAAAHHALGRQLPDEVAAFLGADPLDFTLLGLSALNGPGDMSPFGKRLANAGGEKEFILLDVAAFLADLGLYADAARLLRAVQDLLPESPLLLYHLAFYEELSGNAAEAGALLDRAAALSVDFVLPSGTETLDVLAYAVAARPKDAHAQLLQGHLLAGLHRLEEAVPYWEKAVELDPSLSVAWRLLGVWAQKKKNDLPRAETCFRNALEHRPDDQVLYLDLAEVLAAQDRRTEGIQVIEKLPRTRDPRYDAVLWLAEAYLNEQRFDDCIHLLATARFSNWEGQAKPHDIFVSALLSRGKAALADGRPEEALRDFDTALTYPENLQVGAHYVLTDAEVRYWMGKALAALGRMDDARIAWTIGAAQPTLNDPPLVFVPVTETQDEYVKQCATALDVLALTQP